MNIDQQIADSLERIVELGERILAHLDQQQQERDSDPERMAKAEAKTAAFHNAYMADIAERDRAREALISAMVEQAA
jgi:hypothetical protein